MPTDTPQRLNETPLTQIVKLERQIGELQAELSQHRSGRAASVLATIAISARDTELDDRLFRESVRWLMG